MYIPRSYDVQDPIELHAFMRAHPFATLVTSRGGLYATHLPLLLSPQESLEGHVARANPQRDRIVGGDEVMVIFQGADAHITPAWYPAKAEHGKVVPTWNYAAVHAYGTIRLHDAAEWLHRHVSALTEHHEPARGSEWRVTDAPADFIAQQAKAIVGVEIAITRLEGKWKMSQNRSAADAEGVVRGLRGSGDPLDREVADEMERVRPS